MNGTVSIVFRLYNAATGGTLLWEETQSVQVTTGFYSVALGSVTPFNLPFDQQYFLELEVNSDGPMTPRYALASSPYTLNAKKVAGYEVNPTPQANTLLPLDASARFPSSVIPPVSNADTVDSFHASSTPTPGYLLPLNASGLFPSSVIPPVSNADTVDSIHASATRTPNYLFPLDSTGKFSINAIPTGTAATTCALGNHTHTGVYASIIHTHSPSDIIGSINADTVDGFHASSSPTAGSLLPLDATGKFPSSVIPAVSNADMVDNFHASATPTAGYLLPLNASGMLPSSVIPPVSSADKVDGFDASATPTANYLLALDRHAKFPSGAIRQGSGSGLDADTVDGSHSSAFASASHTHAHGSLTGLGNDDHPQYLLADGSRIMSGGLTTQYVYLPGQYAAVPAGGVGVTIWTALNDNTFYTKLGAASTQHIFNRTVSASSTAGNGIQADTNSASYSGVYGVNTSGGSGDFPAGVYGQSDAASSCGVKGYSANGRAIYGSTSSGYAGYFDGGVRVNGGFQVYGITMMRTVMPEANNTYECGTGSNAWAICRSYAFVTVSSKEKKKDINELSKEEISSILKKVEQIKPVTFYYRGENEPSEDGKVERVRTKPHLGVLAEDLPPEVTDDTGKFVDLGSYCSFLLAAVKELNSEVKERDAKIVTLEGRLSALEKRLSALEAKK